MPKVTAAFSGTVQTNDWWSSLIWQYYPDDPYSTAMFPHPLAIHAWANGLGVSYPTYAVVDNEYNYHFSPEDIRISVAGLNAPDTRVVRYSDWAATARWDDGPRALEITSGHGFPFLYVTLTGGDAVISVTTGPEGLWYNSDGVAGLQVNQHYYGIFGPSGSTWNEIDPIYHHLTSTLNGAGYFAVAVLPDNDLATLDFYRQHAYAFVTATRASWSYDESTAHLSTIYTVTTELKEAGNGNADHPLLALYPHQWRNTADPLTGYRYVSPRGQMKVFDGSSFQTDIVFGGVLPVLPDVGTYDQERLYAYVDEVYANPPYLTPGDTYWEGKDAGRLAQLVWIADQVGHTPARDAFLAALKGRLEDWLNACDGGPSLFYYDDTWDTLIGYPSSYGTDTQLNDHDFHYGYWIMAAATVAHYDHEWAAESNWGGMVDLLIQDVANADRGSTMFPFLRSFDLYAGHDWASGHASFDKGNNEESSSEAINLAAGVILWGAATGNKALRDRGILMYTCMAEAVEQYWFDMDDSVFPAGFDYRGVGIVWGSGGAHATWFGGLPDFPEYIYGINFLPFTGGSLYLGRRPTQVQEIYDAVVLENGGPENDWVDIIWEFLALADPDAAIARFGSGDYLVTAGESRAHTYHWLHTLNGMGHVTTGITADVPTYAVFVTDTVTTYVAYNPTPNTAIVNFSDGSCLVVPAWSMESSPGPASCFRSYLPLVQSRRAAGAP